MWVEIKIRKHIINSGRVTPSRVCELKWKRTHSRCCWCVSHPHGCVSWNQADKRWKNYRDVTPSRVCELKLSGRFIKPDPYVSHPHGCVSWNRSNVVVRYIQCVTPSRVCELKSDAILTISGKKYVTPSRVCELKFPSNVKPKPDNVTPSRVCELKLHILHMVYVYSTVTPSRVCELKYLRFGRLTLSVTSHPHGCVSWNALYTIICLGLLRHTLTGVWVEIQNYWWIW